MTVFESAGTGVMLPFSGIVAIGIRSIGELFFGKVCVRVDAMGLMWSSGSLGRRLDLPVLRPARRSSSWFPTVVDQRRLPIVNTPDHNILDKKNHRMSFELDGSRDTQKREHLTWRRQVLGASPPSLA